MSSRSFKAGMRRTRASGRAIIKNRKARSRRLLSVRRPQNFSSGSHYVDVPTTTLSMNDTVPVILLNQIAQGVSDNARIGKRCQLKSIQLRGNVTASQTPGVTYNRGAYAIVYDRRPTNALPSVTDIFKDRTPNSPNNDNNSTRFRILKRVQVNIHGNFNDDDNDNLLTDHSFFLPLKGLPMIFKSAGTGAIGDLEVGALYLVPLGYEVSATVGIPALHFQARIRFIDTQG